VTAQGAGHEPAAGTETIADWLLSRVDKRTGPVRDRITEAIQQLGDVDRAVYQAIAVTPTPALDEPLRRLSRAADKSKLWFGIIGLLALAGGQDGRRAAVRGSLAIGTTSALVNLGIKPLLERARPDRIGAGVPGVRQVRMPESTSFPSGHSASAFAFATAISRDRPWLALASGFTAAAVAYSRVHTGVHYPGDTVVGSLIGASTGLAVAGLLDSLPTDRSPGPGPGTG
jgi:membrane-associated phospholipid phosphatase